MRRILAVAAAVSLFACAKTESGMPDSAAAAAAPAMLTADMVNGTWNGVTLAEGSDSVLVRWTITRDASMDTGHMVIEGSKDTVTFTSTFDADSMISTSQPYTSAVTPNIGPVMFRSVGRLVDGKLVGMSVITLASKPDSVVRQNRFEAIRQP